jgi:hypothetical protein
VSLIHVEIDDSPYALIDSLTVGRGRASEPLTERVKLALIA